jgi:hypothetical protein
MSQQGGLDLRGVAGDPGVARAPSRKVKKKRGQRKEGDGKALPEGPRLESGGGPGEKEDDMRAWVQGRKVLAVLASGERQTTTNSFHRDLPTGFQLSKRFMCAHRGYMSAPDTRVLPLQGKDE